MSEREGTVNDQPPPNVEPAASQEELVYLQEVTVKNFRNLHSLTVHLQHGLNLIVGRNGTGKSNLFRAIRQALGPASASGDFPWLTPEDRLHEESGEPTTETIRVSLTFAGLSEDQRAQYFEILEYNAETPDESLAHIHFEAPWDAKKERFLPRRWGGPLLGERTEVPAEILSSIPLTFLPALRDAESALLPGRSSRLARLLQDVARNEPNAGYDKEVEAIFRSANEQLALHPLISRAGSKLKDRVDSMAGSDFVEPMIGAADPDFNRILKTLKVLLPQNPVPELSSAGLGYNNLLFIATVLTHLRDSPEEDMPLLLIEEPEAHLHPQMVSRLGSYLAGELGEEVPPQTVVATHSPILASQVRPTQASVLFESRGSGEVCCNSLRGLRLEKSEEKQLERMLDITRATMYFAKGLILVEGISEELLFPQLADIVEADFSANQVSVIPVCGVSFSTLAKVLGTRGLDVRVAIVTDGDPEVETGDTWRGDTPKSDPKGRFEVSKRTTNVIEQFSDDPSIQVFPSSVTLEYDLAAVSRQNAQVMASVWTQLYPGSSVITEDAIAEAESNVEAGLRIWRGVCRSSSSGSKAHFAHALAHRIGLPDTTFDLPMYIRDAFDWVSPSGPENA